MENEATITKTAQPIASPEPSEGEANTEKRLSRHALSPEVERDAEAYDKILTRLLSGSGLMGIAGVLVTYGIKMLIQHSYWPAIPLVIGGILLFIAATPAFIFAFAGFIGSKYFGGSRSLRHRLVGITFSIFFVIVFVSLFYALTEDLIG